MEKYYYSWLDFDRDVKELTKIFEGREKFHIIGIAKGGLPLATYLANKLDSSLDVIKASSYKNKKQGPLQIDYGNLSQVSTKSVLLVDDIVDSGATMKTIHQNLLYKFYNVGTVSLFYKQKATFTPNIYLHKTKDWVVFPWEN